MSATYTSCSKATNKSREYERSETFPRSAGTSYGMYDMYCRSFWSKASAQTLTDLHAAFVCHQQIRHLQVPDGKMEEDNDTPATVQLIKLAFYQPSRLGMSDRHRGTILESHLMHQLAGRSQCVFLLSDFVSEWRENKCRHIIHHSNPVLTCRI